MNTAMKFVNYQRATQQPLTPWKDILPTTLSKKQIDAMLTSAEKTFANQLEQASQFDILPYFRK